MIEREMVSKVALLARLKLDEGELSAIAEQLGKITAYIDQLAAVDVSGVTLEFKDEENSWREDEIRPSQRPESLLSNAPRSEAGYIVVPKVVDDTVVDGMEG